jgi:uncharacterized protein (DUF433 family)
MGLTLEALEVPIQINEHGVARVGGTRVSLESVIAAFHRGETPEQVIGSFDVLSLADVYAVFAYYLNHRDEVDEYIRQSELKAEETYRRLKSEHPEIFSMEDTLRERLKKRG